MRLKIKNQTGYASIDELDIDWPDEPNSLHYEKWEELNYRIWDYHKTGKCYDWKQLRKEIEINFPKSALLDSGTWTIVEITSDESLCYDFFSMIEARTASLINMHRSYIGHHPFSTYEGMIDLLEYFKTSIYYDIEGKIPPSLIFNDTRYSWSDLTMCDPPAGIDDFEEDIDWEEIDDYYSVDEPISLAEEMQQYQSYNDGMDYERRKLLQQKSDASKALIKEKSKNASIKRLELKEAEYNGRIFQIESELKYIGR